MRYPNLRYGNPNELAYYAAFYPPKERIRRLARELRRDERTVRDWLSGQKKVPFWVPELIRLRRMEHEDMLRQMGFQAMETRLGVVKGSVLEFRPPRPEKKPQDAICEPGALFSLRRSG